MRKFTSRPHLILRRLAGVLALLGSAFSAPSATAAGQPLDRWEQLRSQDLRVASVAYRLSVLNAGLCPDALDAQAGIVLHSIDQYELAEQEGAARNFGLSPTAAGVMAVVAGSPAQRAGLAADDQLVSVNGRSLRVTLVPANAEPIRTAAAFAQAVLAMEMARGEVTMRVSRAGAFHDLRFTANVGCTSDVTVVTGRETNAWADGQGVVISDGLVTLCATDGDLALVIAHELAHNLLGHGERPVEASSASPFRSTRSESASSRETEEAADRLGVGLAKGASYDLSNVLAFVESLIERDGEPVAPGTHPSPARRLALLKAEIGAELLQL